MATVLIALVFCLACSAVLRAPMAILYIVGIPLAFLVGFALLWAISPALVIGIAITGFFYSLERTLSRR